MKATWIKHVYIRNVRHDDLVLFRVRTLGTAGSGVERASTAFGYTAHWLVFLGKGMHPWATKAHLIASEYSGKSISWQDLSESSGLLSLLACASSAFGLKGRDRHWRR